MLKATDKLNKKLSYGTKFITSQVDRYKVHSINNKTDSIPSLDNLSQSNTCTQIVHTKQDLMRLFQGCFQGLGKLQDEPYHIEVDPRPKCTTQNDSSGPVPVHSEAAFKQQLVEMQAAGNNRTVDYATPYINISVMVNKKQLDRHGTPDGIFHKLSQPKMFITVVISKGYYHIELDEAISFLTMFNTPFGRFRFTRMAVAGDTFQHKLDAVFSNPDFCIGIAGDMVI